MDHRLRVSLLTSGFPNHAPRWYDLAHWRIRMELFLFFFWIEKCDQQLRQIGDGGQARLFCSCDLIVERANCVSAKTTHTYQSWKQRNQVAAQIMWTTPASVLYILLYWVRWNKCGLRSRACFYFCIVVMWLRSIIRIEYDDPRIFRETSSVRRTLNREGCQRIRKPTLCLEIRAPRTDVIAFTKPG